MKMLSGFSISGFQLVFPINLLFLFLLRRAFYMGNGSNRPVCLFISLSKIAILLNLFVKLLRIFFTNVVLHSVCTNNQCQPQLTVVDYSRAIGTAATAACLLIAKTSWKFQILVKSKSICFNIKKGSAIRNKELNRDSQLLSKYLLLVNHHHCLNHHHHHHHNHLPANIVQKKCFGFSMYFYCLVVLHNAHRVTVVVFENLSFLRNWSKCLGR